MRGSRFTPPGRPFLGRMHPLATALAVACSALIAPQAVHAQTYTGVSVLAPFGTTQISPGEALNAGTPVAVASSGQVVGFARTGNQRVFDLASFSFRYSYTQQAVVWAPASGSGTVKPTASPSSVWPLAGNALGSWTGYALGSTKITQGTSFPRIGVDLPAVWINGKLTKINGATSKWFTPIAMNAQNWVLGNALGDANGQGSNIRGLIWKNGSVVELDLAGANKAFPVAMNDQGDAVGMVRNENWVNGALQSYTERAALWVNNRLTWLGPDGSFAFAINNLGQFLVSNPDQPSGVELRTTSGGVTPLVPPPGQEFSQILLNNKGELGVLMQTYDPVNDSRGPMRPFVWKNGTMVDVQAQLAARGIALTEGQRNHINRLAAFTDQGVMVMRHDNPFNSWMRVNVAP